MNADDAIRQRRSVRRYTDAPVSDADVDALLRLALLAPTGGMSQAWSFIVVRDEPTRTALAELMIAGGGQYFATVRPPAPGATAEEHAQWGRDYAEQALGLMRNVPVWIVGLVVPRGAFPADQREAERTADLVSLAFAMENLFVAARARGLGTVPMVFHWFLEAEFRELLQIPDELEIPIVSPLGYPVEFPTSLPPALKAIKRPWRTLVHDDRWGNPRQQPGDAK